MVSISEPTRGQDKRKLIVQRIEASLGRFCPDTLDRISDKIAYENFLSPYTVRYTYLPMLITVGVLVACGNGIYDLSTSIKETQTKKQIDQSIDDNFRKACPESTKLLEKKRGKP